jgi:hypothetical protein
MFEHAESEFKKHENDTYVRLLEEIQRPALLMIPKDNNFDPQFPAMFYRMGKYVSQE